jgi:hypothetical protein
MLSFLLVGSFGEQSLNFFELNFVIHEMRSSDIVSLVEDLMTWSKKGFGGVKPLCRWEPWQWCLSSWVGHSSFSFNLC